MEKAIDKARVGFSQGKSAKIWISSPHMGGSEEFYVKRAFESNWVAPHGPNVDAFEEQIVKFTGCGHAVVLSSGTAALHLAMILLGVEKDDYVICQSLTFAASANPIRYQEALPVFVDSEPDTWNLCPQALEDAIKHCLSGKIGARAQLPKAIVAVDLYGMPAKWHEIREVADRYGIPIIEDAAEALGSTYQEKFCGTFGDIGVFSFNGNKIITSSGGGALVSKTKAFVDRALFLSTQAREDYAHYEHTELGYNYRMSNISAGIGLGQMEVLSIRIDQRRRNFARYKAELQEFEGLVFKDEPAGSHSNRWLSTLLVSPDLTAGITREDIRIGLMKSNIEARPIWKPMHLQPLYKEMPFVGGSVASSLFDKGLCLPSGSNLTEDDLARVIACVQETL
ncbi:4-keto-6-deoxy-N-Acetyl-D-hexosaminyl-(Lipid carrier) aminotransferase [Lunatimonas lonarensis]|uniref:4-keto-6-deoxy-N-Acetyl-D-hexosaminyl-(Lipid carrier) aminotransferase n=1 Tax=Lunatimonas lonarensis TaxID=1232681 RepID=R7ZZH6_9BACT|nr:aminotransferase class I/II-fold pyridoxal phosphate-dependent enzyme [Lunatimonas lonarensis]EON79459.1 4-keto-6-deoxy-N-Acetyl-D-hexosaminyl-(Lipid carrier) aminotransferase [Lunatimonas lonarensis]